MAAVFASIVFFFGYFFITLESKLRISKSGFALAMGGTLWVILGLHDPVLVKEEIIHTGYDIFSIVVFLLAAMSLVEVLAHYRIFDLVRGKIFEYKLTDKKQLIILSICAFALSAVIDNLTTTIVMIQIARKFFTGRNLLVASVATVIIANAGGAFSPIGDVTTIMLWLAGKFEASDIILQGFLPSLALLVTALAMLLPQIKEKGGDPSGEIVVKLSRSEKGVVALAFLSFLFPIMAKWVGLPPVLGILFGLGLIWIVVDLLKVYHGGQTHLSASIEHLIQKTDIASIKFFIGILLAVSALGALGVLDYVSHFVYGSGEGITRIIGGNVFLGMISSFLDNIPLTAIAIDILPVSDPSLWVLLALTVGTGGSLLSLGSAAGVVAMGLVKELTFPAYFRIGFMPALVSFFVCVGVWLLQYLFLL